LPFQIQEKKNSARRQAILEAAEKLFAQQGYLAAPLNQINREAGQKNTAALHYHFGSREALLEEIVSQHLSDINAELEILLDKLEPPVSIREFVAAYVTPYLSKLDSERGVRYLQIVAQVVSVNADIMVVPRSQNMRGRIGDLIGDQLGDTRPHSINPRMIAFTILLINELCLVSRMSPAEIRRVFGGKKKFREHLISTLTVVLSPLS
jgi:AcrR family transcriptional regulator